METILYPILIVISTFLFMEGVSWFTHKYIMHGILWSLHKDHHKKKSSGFFEQNDFFFVIFSTPSIVTLYFGSQDNFNFLFWIGLGITLYGFAYFFVHEIFIHQRFKFIRNSNYRYFKALRRAHKIHHKHLNKQDGECFGMLWVPLKYFRDLKSNNDAS